MQAHGIPVRQGAPGEPFLTMEEYIPTLEAANADWWPVVSDDVQATADEAASRAELARECFAPDALLPYKARGLFAQKYGIEAHNEEMREVARDADQAGTRYQEQHRGRRHRGRRHRGRRHRGRHQVRARRRPERQSLALSSFPEAGRQAAIVKFIQTFGTQRAARMAKAANADLAGRPLNALVRDKINQEKERDHHATAKIEEPLPRGTRRTSRAMERGKTFRLRTGRTVSASNFLWRVALPTNTVVPGAGHPDPHPAANVPIHDAHNSKVPVLDDSQFKTTTAGSGTPIYLQAEPVDGRGGVHKGARLPETTTRSKA